VSFGEKKAVFHGEGKCRSRPTIDVHTEGNIKAGKKIRNCKTNMKLWMAEGGIKGKKRQESSGYRGIISISIEPFLDIGVKKRRSSPGSREKKVKKDGEVNSRRRRA